MNIKIVELPEIAIIGKEGFCTEESNIDGISIETSSVELT